MSFLITYLVFWAAVGAGVGTLIGRSKGRGAAGFWLGLLLGWIGWIVIGLMSRTPEADARHNIAVVAASQRLTGTPAPRSPATMQSKRVTDQALASIRTQANGDPDVAAVHAAINRFALDKHPQRMLSDWFFAGGAFQFVARYDGVLYACNQDTTRTVSTSAKTAGATYAADGNGTVVVATIDDATFQRPRPPSNVTRILESLRATRVEAPSPTSTPAPATFPAPVLGSSGAASSADAIRALRTLLDEGLLDQDEYDRKRREVIDRI